MAMDYCPLCCKKMENYEKKDDGIPPTKRCVNPDCPCDVVLWNDMSFVETFPIAALIKLRESG